MKDAAISFMDDKCLKLSASLSYYTVFSIGPVLIIVISLVSLFYGREAVEGEIFSEMHEMIGITAATQLEQIIANIESSKTKGSGLTLGIITLLFGASGVFAEIQDSINTIWSVKAAPQKGWLKFIINRLLSFSLIAAIGFILLVSLMLSALLEVMSARLASHFPDSTVIIAKILNFAIPLAIITILFIIIFKVLPDAIVGWKEVIAGSLFTALLFMLGKYLIGIYINQSNFSTTYGAASSIIILLTWVYYSSVIVYFGAEFTKSYALHRDKKIIPKDSAVYVVKSEIKKDLS